MIEQSTMAIGPHAISPDEQLLRDAKDKRIAELEAQLAVAQNESAIYDLPKRIIAMCKARGWSMHWTHRGAYLHLEASELIEAIRGKHGDPVEEAGDVLLVLMSITEYAEIPFWKVIDKAIGKLTHLENAPHYPGEEYEATKP
jgi:NTP pyrophosphatase (non-canonical NTP hydrolase)